MSQHSGKIRILGIDPGTTTLGFAIGEICTETKTVDVIEAVTMDGGKALKEKPHILNKVEIRGERWARLEALSELIYNGLLTYRPNFVGIESAYARAKTISAYAPLVECAGMVRDTVYRYDAAIVPTMVPPPSAKAAVGVTAKGSDKEDIKTAIAEQEGLSYSGDVPYDMLDEHATDAIAVMYQQALLALEEY